MGQLVRRWWITMLLNVVAKVGVLVCGGRGRVVGVGSGDGEGGSVASVEVVL